jgi:dihydropyrimidine dehydrogenase (NAD+) subunit PreA
MLFAGADLVQVYSYLHDYGTQAPEATTKIIEDFKVYLDHHNIQSVESIKGKALDIMQLPTELTPQIPEVNDDLCTGCDRCVPICLPNAIDLLPSSNRNGHVVEIIGKACVGCGLCVAVCPVEGALKLPK